MSDLDPASPPVDPTPPPPAAPSDLAARAAALRAARPGLRIRDLAKALGVGELHLLDLDRGPDVLPLRGTPAELLGAASTVGRCMALTRNDTAVHERKGDYLDVRFEAHVGLVLGPDIDLRVFPAHWAAARAVRATIHGRPRQSLQFFDAHGDAVHKVYLEAESAPGAWDALVARFADPTAPTPAPAGPRPARPHTPIAPAPDFLDQWAALRDTHDFFGLLRRHQLSPADAFAAAAGRFSNAVPTDTLHRLLLACAETGVPIMVFVGNPGCIQIHTGPIHRVSLAGPWVNVLDPDFNLHVDTAQVRGAWAVCKPTTDGPVHSLELLDDAGEVSVRVFGARKPGRPEDPRWVEVLDAVGARAPGGGA